MENNAARFLARALVVLQVFLWTSTEPRADQNPEAYIEGFVQSVYGHGIDGTITFEYWRGTADECHLANPACASRTYTATITDGWYRTQSRLETTPTQVYKVTLDVGGRSIFTPAFPSPILRANNWSTLGPGSNVVNVRMSSNEILAIFKGLNTASNTHFSTGNLIHNSSFENPSYEFEGARTSGWVPNFDVYTKVVSPEIKGHLNRALSLQPQLPSTAQFTAIYSITNEDPGFQVLKKAKAEGKSVVLSFMAMADWMEEGGSPRIKAPYSSVWSQVPLDRWAANSASISLADVPIVQDFGFERIDFEFSFDMNQETSDYPLAFLLDNLSLALDEGPLSGGWSSTINYTDGEAKVEQSQTIHPGASGLERTVLKSDFDMLGRPWRTWLPGGEACESDDCYRFSMLDIVDYYSITHPSRPDAGGYPYAETVWEPDPLARTLRSTRPGLAYSKSQVPFRNPVTAYSGTNSLDETLLGTNKASPPATLTSNPIFSYTHIADAHQVPSLSWADALGNVLKTGTIQEDGSLNGSENVYDERSRLIKTLPPNACEDRDGNSLERPNCLAPTRFAYNSQGLVASEMTPEAGQVSKLYDPLGQVRFTQTSRQAMTGAFSFKKYDGLSRTVLEGEILNGALFTQANADKGAFPCIGCGDPSLEVEPYLIKVRTVYHYDTENADISCQGGGVGSPGSREILFLAIGPDGTVVAAGNELVPVYQEATGATAGQTGNMQVLALYSPSGNQVVRPDPGSEINAITGIISYLRFVSKESQEGLEALQQYEEFQSQQSQALLGPGTNLQGKLVKSLACNYELSEALGESGPREVSKTYRYDNVGRILKVLETNRYANSSANQIQILTYTYDSHDRVVSREACNTLPCPDWRKHVENVEYDNIGRLTRVSDKSGATILENHYNGAGQIEKRDLGHAGHSPSHALVEEFEYNLENAFKSSRMKRVSDGSYLFQEDVDYEDGATPRYDGRISGARYRYAQATTSQPDLQYDFEYDRLKRLTASTVTGTGPDRTTSYSFLMDGRLSQVTRGDRSGAYRYYANGRLQEVIGDLVENRVMSLTPANTTVFEYDENGNLEIDKSKAVDNEPLRIYYRSDNLPYMFVLRTPGASEEAFDEKVIYMAYGDDGSRVGKIIHVNDVEKAVTSYFGTGAEVREEDGKDPVVIHDMAGVGRIRYGEGSPQGEREYNIKDHLGSLRELYDFDVGSVTYASHYFPYGLQFSEFNTAENEVTQKFTGKELDEELGLNYFGARYYDPGIGQWISPDAARQYHSLYAYAPDPINSVDRDGNLATEFVVDQALKDYLTPEPTDANPWKGVVYVAAGILGALADLAFEDALEEVFDGPMHGNDNRSTKEHHVYEIYNVQTGDVVKVGESGQTIRADGKSPRAEVSVRRFNRKDGPGTYDQRIVLRGIINKQMAKYYEREVVNLRDAQMHSLKYHTRPIPPSRIKP